MSMSSNRYLIAVWAIFALLSGCSDEPVCAEVSAECAPLYEPTFENVFDITLSQRCAVAGGVCHAAEGAQAGIVFVDIDDSYDLLTGGAGGRVLVDPAALGCGTLLSRVAADDPARTMPPNAPLSEAERCSIIQWVAAGAVR